MIPRESPPVPAPREAVILAVDDRYANLIALERALAGIPARIVKVTSGEEALAASLKDAFALAILDVQMPGMDGYELAEILLSDPATARTPIIFVTAAYSDEAHLFKGYTAGAVDYLVKPYDPAILRSKVRVFLELAQHRHDLEGLVAERTRALRASEERYRTLFETMSQGVVYEDADGQIIEANPAALQLLGLSRAALVGTRLDALDWRASRDDGAALSREDFPSVVARSTGRAVDNHVVGLRRPADGVDVWVRASAFPQTRPGESRPYQVYLTLSDVTARRRAERRLEDSDRALRAVFDGTPDGVLAVDAETFEVQMANDGMLRMLGAPGLAARASVYDLLPREYVVLLFARCAGNEALPQQLLDVQVSVPAGEPIVLDASLTWVELRGRRCLLGMFRDMTDRRRAEVERQRLQTELFQTQKMESIGVLAGGIAHDFNNLLSVIQGYVDLALMQLDDDDPIRVDLEVAHKAAERSAALTRQLLAFGRKQLMQRAPLDLNEVAREVERLLRRIIGEDVELVLRLADDLRPVLADAGQIEQVIMNLAVNARDAMPGGGRIELVTVNAEADPEGARALGLQPNAYVRLAVRDTGSGIDAETLPLIFDPFFTTKAEGKGTGLGLSSVYGIVKQSEGHLRVLSEVGKGSTFELYLPRIEGARHVAQPAAAASHGLREGSETILVVEDDDAVRNLAARALVAVGYEVLTASDGVEALRVYEALPRPVHLVVSDVVMPRMGGEELAARLRAMRPDTKLLFMTGYPGTAFRTEAAYDPHRTFIAKPFRVEELARTVRRLLDHEGAPSAP